MTDKPHHEDLFERAEKEICDAMERADRDDKCLPCMGVELATSALSIVLENSVFRQKDTFADPGEVKSRLEHIINSVVGKALAIAEREAMDEEEERARLN